MVRQRAPAREGHSFSGRKYPVYPKIGYLCTGKTTGISRTAGYRTAGLRAEIYRFGIFLTIFDVINDTTQ